MSWSPLWLHPIMTICLSYHFWWDSLALEKLRLALLLFACLLPTAVFQRGRSVSRLADTRWPTYKTIFCLGLKTGWWSSIPETISLSMFLSDRLPWLIKTFRPGLDVLCTCLHGNQGEDQVSAISELGGRQSGKGAGRGSQGGGSRGKGRRRRPRE